MERGCIKQVLVVALVGPREGSKARKQDLCSQGERAYGHSGFSCTSTERFGCFDGLGVRSPAVCTGGPVLHDVPGPSNQEMCIPSVEGLDRMDAHFFSSQFRVAPLLFRKDLIGAGGQLWLSIHCAACIHGALLEGGL